MHRHRNPASWVGLGISVLSLALVMAVASFLPAQAADGRAASPQASAPVARSHAPAGQALRATTPKPDPIRIHVPGGPDSSSVDWQWLYGRWQIRFNWAETRQMSRGFSYCTAIAGLVPHWTSRVVTGACGLLWILADSAVAARKCVEAYVSINVGNPISFGRWNCPT